jgi:hypothetical protein
MRNQDQCAKHEWSKQLRDREVGDLLLTVVNSNRCDSVALVAQWVDQTRSDHYCVLASLRVYFRTSHMAWE